ncbi:MAG: hypothetical protein ACTHMT_07505 [Verrucomicrobiota bacterium]
MIAEGTGACTLGAGVFALGGVYVRMGTFWSARFCAGRLYDSCLPRVGLTAGCLCVGPGAGEGWRTLGVGEGATLGCRTDGAGLIVGRFTEGAGEIAGWRTDGEGEVIEPGCRMPGVGLLVGRDCVGTRVLGTLEGVCGL